MLTSDAVKTRRKKGESSRRERAKRGERRRKGERGREERKDPDRPTPSAL